MIDYNDLANFNFSKLNRCFVCNKFIVKKNYKICTILLCDNHFVAKEVFSHDIKNINNDFYFEIVLFDKVYLNQTFRYNNSIGSIIDFWEITDYKDIYNYKKILSGSGKIPDLEFIKNYYKNYIILQ